MHDILEGVCSYDLSGLLYKFIINLKYFSLDTSNNRLQYYGPLEVQNKVQVKGIRYKQRMIVIIDVKDMPIFVIVKYIFFKLQCDIPFLISQRISTIGFNEHLQAYEIKNSDDENYVFHLIIYS